jgi:hypothetical protein
MNPIQRAVAAEYYFDGRHDSDFRLNLVHSRAFFLRYAARILSMGLVDESAAASNPIKFVCRLIADSVRASASSGKSASRLSNLNPKNGNQTAIPIELLLRL